MRLSQSAFILYFMGVLAFTACSKSVSIPEEIDPPLGEIVTDTTVIALAGNAYITTAPENSTVIINNNGLANWNNAQTVTSVFFRVHKVGQLNLGLKGYLSTGNSSAQITVRQLETNNTLVDTIHLSGATAKNYPIKPFEVTSIGYIQVDIQGLERSHGYFGDLSDLLVSGEPTTAEVTYVHDPGSYNFGRRGASTHLRYPRPPNKDILYFYNEITISEGNDVVGSFFMANGFVGGYFGMQVNSAQERRILFSIWSPFQTDNPEDIPLEDRVILNRRGSGVNTGTFGNEGSGGQSYFRFPWVAGTTYQFLSKVEPDGAGNTDYTAWFKPKGMQTWKLIASWKRPKTNVYHEDIHSFLENFRPVTGYLTRKGVYANQYAYSTDRQWHEITEARFTSDNTRRNRHRLDIKSGSEGNSFFLQINGFFNDIMAPNQVITRQAGGEIPAIDFDRLP